jgi:sulfur-carrier protein
MKIKIKYFGMIAESIEKEEETIDVNFKTVDELRNYFEQIGNMNYEIAVNQNIVADDFDLNENDEVALLPAFAGG